MQSRKKRDSGGWCSPSPLEACGDRILSRSVAEYWTNHEGFYDSNVDLTGNGDLLIHI